MKEVTVSELKQMRDNKEVHQLIDVREMHEVEAGNIGGEHIPMGDVMANLDKISKDEKVIIHCKAGGRSGAIVNALESQGFTNVYNLKGGMLAWAKEIDNSLNVI